MSIFNLLKFSESIFSTTLASGKSILVLLLFGDPIMVTSHPKLLDILHKGEASCSVPIMINLITGNKTSLKINPFFKVFSLLLNLFEDLLYKISDPWFNSSVFFLS